MINFLCLFGSLSIFFNSTFYLTTEVPALAAIFDVLLTSAAWAVAPYLTAPLLSFPPISIADFAITFIL